MTTPKHTHEPWISAGEKLPPIDDTNDWNKMYRISNNVLTFSEKWGMRFGRYFYDAEFWTVDGVTSSNGIIVEFWCDIKPPSK